jgi:DNA-binding Lrp family transcriptional regulator
MEYNHFQWKKGAMEKKDLYSAGHLIVAAIRVLDHQKGMPPDIETLGQALSFSTEECLFFCRRLEKSGIIKIVESAFGIKLFIKDHLELEKLPRTENDTPIKDDIEKFMSQKQDQFKEIESIKAKQDQKKKDLFAEIEQKLKDKIKTGPK